MFVLNHASAHKFVHEQARKGNDVRWDGWEMVFWKPTHYGFTSVNGSFRNKRWGVEARVQVDSDGQWRVPNRNAK